MCVIQSTWLSLDKTVPSLTLLTYGYVWPPGHCSATSTLHQQASERWQMVAGVRLKLCKVIGRQMPHLRCSHKAMQTKSIRKGRTHIWDSQAGDPGTALSQSLERCQNKVRVLVTTRVDVSNRKVELCSIHFVRRIGPSKAITLWTKALTATWSSFFVSTHFCLFEFCAVLKAKVNLSKTNHESPFT